MSVSKYGIVGTAPSWKKTPWSDTSFLLASLNDAYQLGPQGFQRADEWFDPHPLDHFLYPDGKVVYPHTIPPGHYVRPKDHLKWLGEQTIPVYLNPGYLQQHPPAKDWAHARPLPVQDIVAHFGQYFTSTPQWMMALGIMRGFVDFWIWGIHLATQQEYRDQRPGFEFLIGRLLGRGKIRETVADGMRHYETNEGHVALPVESPVLQAKFQYALEPRPGPHLAPLEWEMHKLQIKRDRTIQALKQRPWWQPIGAIQEPGEDGTPVRRICSTAALQNELWYLEAAMADTQQEMQRLTLQAGG